MTCKQEEEEEDPVGSSSTCRYERVEPAKLMDDYWFFDNMLKTTRAFKPSTDACCSNTTKEMVISKEEGRLPSTTSALAEDGVLATSNLLRTPSLPPDIGKEKPTQGPVERNSSLQRSFSSVDRNQRRPSKVSTPRSIIPRDRSVGVSLSDLEIEEVKGFMDLGFVFNREDMNPSILNMIPGLQNKRPDGDCDGGGKVRRPYLSEAWFVQRSEAPLLNWVDRKSAADVKKQLKVWARAVASNVRQEC